MGATPTTDNPALDTFDSIASDVVLNRVLPVAEKALETYAEAQLPFLALPGIKQMFEGLTDIEAKILATELLTVMVQVGVKIIVTVQTNEEKSTYLAAEGALKAALLSKDTQKIATAREAFNAAVDSVIHSDGFLHGQPVANP